MFKDEKKPPEGGLDMGVITIDADARPLISFVELFRAALKRKKRPFNLFDRGFELARIESFSDPASARKITVRFYPSDAFLRFAAAALAGDFDVKTVK